MLKAARKNDSLRDKGRWALRNTNLMHMYGRREVGIVWLDARLGTNQGQSRAKLAEGPTVWEGMGDLGSEEQAETCGRPYWWDAISSGGKVHPKRLFLAPDHYEQDRSHAMVWC